MFNSLRNDLTMFIPKNSSYKDNLGLRLEKLNSGIDNPNNQEHDEKDAALNIMANFKPEAIKTSYSYSFNEWQTAMQNQPDTECFEIKSSTKVLLGTGNAAVYEFGFNLSKPHGAPYISGSSLKGLVSAYLAKSGNDDWLKANTNTEKSAYQVQLFGGRYENNDYIGSVNFYDARISPNTNNWFVHDIITPHHKEYYSGNRLPDGTENPIPIKISALDIGLTFFVVLQGSEKDRKFVKKILLEALTVDGIGGKTAVGYGRFEYVPSKEEKYDKIKELSLEDLKTFKFSDKRVGDDPSYDNAIRYALEHNDICTDLTTKYKKYCPLKYIRLKLASCDKPTIELLNLDKQTKRNFNNYPTPNNSDDGKFIFNYALENLKLSSQDIENNTILQNCAYTWDNVEITKDNIEDIICNLSDRIWPPAKELKDFIEKSSLPNKDEALELLEIELDEL